MFFNSLSFLPFFLAVFVAILFATNLLRNIVLRNVILLAASYVFYGSFRAEFLIILVYITLVNYLFPILGERWAKHKKLLLGADVVFSLLPLLTYKYLLFFISALRGLLQLDLPLPDTSGWMMPIGISFFTFQALTYSIDVHRGKIPLSKNLLNIALFIAFFPTILSGPIEKARNLLPQLLVVSKIDLSGFYQGLAVFVWGLFKKMVIADRLAVYVDRAYGNIDYSSGSTLALAAVFYSIQIYCDFSGYSDMAIGVGRALGFKISKNFWFPYFSASIKTFWKKWHISLTSWLTEYVYISLGGNRVGKFRWIINISLVFLISGLWHGAAWTFIIWGALHAVYYLIEHYTGLKSDGISVCRKAVQGTLLFFLVTVAWVFFRADTFSDAISIVVKSLSDWSLGFSVGASRFTFALNLLLLAMFAVCESLLYTGIINIYDDDTSDSISVKNILWVTAVILSIGLFGVSTGAFVYFQF